MSRQSMYTLFSRSEKTDTYKDSNVAQGSMLSNAKHAYKQSAHAKQTPRVGKEKIFTSTSSGQVTARKGMIAVGKSAAYQAHTTIKNN